MNGKSRDVRDAWNVNVSFVYEFWFRLRHSGSGLNV